MDFPQNTQQICLSLWRQIIKDLLQISFPFQMVILYFNKLKSMGSYKIHKLYTLKHVNVTAHQRASA